MPKKLLATTIITAILVLVISVQVVEVVNANPVPYTQTPNLERPALTTASPLNYSTYTHKDIALNLTINQPNSWNAVHWVIHYVGEINKVEVYLDGNQTAEYTANHIYKYLNGNKTMIYPEDVRDEFSLSNICDWINQTTPGMHTLNVTVISHTYSLSYYPGSNEEKGAMYDGQPIYEYPIIVSDTIYFTVEGQEPITSTMPSSDKGLLSNSIPILAIAGVIVIVAVASISFVYFKRRKGKA